VTEKRQSEKRGGGYGGGIKSGRKCTTMIDETMKMLLKWRECLKRNTKRSAWIKPRSRLLSQET